MQCSARLMLIFALLTISCSRFNLKYAAKGFDINRVYQNLSPTVSLNDQGDRFVWATAYFTLDNTYNGSALALPPTHELTFCGNPMEIDESSGQYRSQTSDQSTTDACVFRWVTDTGDTYVNPCHESTLTVSGGLPSSISKAAGITVVVVMDAAWASQTVSLSFAQYSPNGPTTARSNTVAGEVGSDGRVSIVVKPEDVASLQLGTADLSIIGNLVSQQVNGPANLGRLQTSVMLSSNVIVAN